MAEGTRARSIREKLVTAFKPSRLDLVDESARHAGHAGAPAGGESHFRLTIIAPAFDGKSRVERHRMVNQVLAAELAAGLHALTIKALGEQDAD
ncbi:MAG: BolA/IbaG family iron-sulfur metabolism protein [Alphaproteobacteria bacterium]|nr:BolA/IbaG family iron-sulfur metabolism protein [Alphaproteobacteria bacterium]